MLMVKSLGRQTNGVDQSSARNRFIEVAVRLLLLDARKSAFIRRHSIASHPFE
ncbi:MAG: hypothetical protein JXA30_17185 [Deltaproteobacteria bacterium]|nr:hypothetical protein [Deltaproteobacteria bacterium]